MSLLATLRSRLAPAPSLDHTLSLATYVFVRAVPCLLLVPQVRSAAVANDALPAHLRVKIFHDARLTRLSLRLDEGALQARFGPDSPALALEAGTTYRIVLDGARVCLESDAARSCGSALQVAPDTDETTYTLVAEQGAPTASPARRSYQGALSVRPDAQRPGTLRAVHTVALDLYVAGVVQREYGMADLEGSKAMAVLARTYALRQRGRAVDYDLVDTIDHQVYFGVAGIRDVARQAATETRGEVLTYQGRLAEAVYSASSGGFTAANHQVWNSQPVAYLRAQPDPYDARMSPHANWTSRLDAAAFLTALSRSFGPDVVDFGVTSRTSDGRAQQVQITLADGTNKLITATQFRRVANGLGGAMTLRSFKFEARLEGDKAVFNGSGFGHGVGLSQWGARAQALEGRSYRQILGFYYPGTAIRTRSGLAEPTPTGPNLDVFLVDRGAERTAPAAAPARPAATPASEPMATNVRPGRNASTRVRLPAPDAAPRPAAPNAPADAVPTPTADEAAPRPASDRIAARPARTSAPLPDGAYRRDPLGVRSAPPVPRDEAAEAAEAVLDPAPEALPAASEARAERTIVTWGAGPATPAGGAARPPARRSGW